jgi:hypothetical protein
MNPINNGILEEAVKYFGELDKTAELYKKDGQWLRPGSSPMFYSDFGDTTEKILYVGMNPSITEKMESWFIEVHGSDSMLNLEYLKGLELSKKEETINKLIEFQAALKGKIELSGGVKRIPYFTTLDNFHKTAFSNSSPSWEHYDIFNYRSTYQPHLKRSFRKKNLISSKHLNELFVSSINRFGDIVKSKNFKCIVVLNALASSYLRENKILGLERLSNGDTGNIILAKQLTVGGTTKNERKELLTRMRKLANI